MTLDGCINKIDGHLSKDNVEPLIVDVQNQNDYSALLTHYNVGSNKVIKTFDYCKQDELPQLDALFHDLETNQGTFFVTGLSSFLKLFGERELKKVMNEILSMTTAGHVVIVTYQCKQYLDFEDPRLQPRIVVVDGEAQNTPEICFCSPSLSINDAQAIEGIDAFAEVVTRAPSQKIMVVTKKRKDDFRNSLYKIVSMSKAYDALVLKDSMTSQISEYCGSEEQWAYALEQFKNRDGWGSVIDKVIGNHQSLDVCAPKYPTMTANERWLFFVGLKLFGAAKNWCLNYAASKSNGPKDLESNIYRGILDKNVGDQDFWDCYTSRKNLIMQIGNPSAELTSYCNVVAAKGKDAIFYLTDNSVQEKEKIFDLLDRYGTIYKREELTKILEKVYPDLYAYLYPYRFKNDMLDKYFQDYKYQKIINKVFPEFECIVFEQAEKREYNRILSPRSSCLEKLNTSSSMLYFMDAMGVEYLGYISAVCREFGLNTKITVCRCELPSITSKNKEFLELWPDDKIVSIKDIDEVKHHGKFDYDYYSNSKLPLHLIKELEIIRDTLEKIRNKLVDGTITCAVMIADHGASRLAVLHDTENVWEMAEKGQHSGRCCPKSDVDVAPDYATDAGDFWALANYDRFKGGRKANVEVHGGATLEEICVPIVEITYSAGKPEVHLMRADADAVDFTETLEIEVSFRKKAAIKIFMTAELDDVNIRIAGKTYEAKALGNGYYFVDMHDFREPGTYFVDVYSQDNVVAENLVLVVKREGQQEKDLL